jgi:outer membrane protein assembly factor BamA
MGKGKRQDRNNSTMIKATKKRDYIPYLIAIFIYMTGILETYPAQATAGAEADSPQSSEQNQNKRQIAFFPVFFYSDETRLAGGGGLQVVHNKQPERRSSTTGIIGFYTQNKQYNLGIGPEIYWKDGTYKLLGQFAYSYFPDKFYGISNNTSKDDEENYTSRLIAINPSLQKEVIPNLYAGFYYFYGRAGVTDREGPKLISGENVPGRDGGVVSGTGLTISWDSRDNNLYPTGGSYHQFRAGSYRSFLGSDFNYDSYMLDLRHYRHLFSGHILAVQGLFGSMSGNPPFQVMGLKGLGTFLRGYYQSRFVDKNVMALQAEYRLPLFWRFGLVGFLGLGQVAGTVKNISIGELKPSTGFGFRFALIPEQKVNLRIDIGIGKDDSSFDINITELF